MRLRSLEQERRARDWGFLLGLAVVVLGVASSPFDVASGREEVIPGVR